MNTSVKANINSSLDNEDDDGLWSWYKYCFTEADLTRPKVAMFCNSINLLTFASAYILPIIISIGALTNLHIIYIFLFRMPNRSRQMIYLIFLAMADLINIVVIGWLDMFLQHGMLHITKAKSNIELYYISPLSCSLYATVKKFSTSFACTVYVLLCFDRFVAIYWPLKAHKWTTKIAWILSGVCVLFCIALAIPFAIFTKGNENTCGIKDNPFFWVSYTVLLTNAGLVQSFLVVVINMGLIIRVKQMNNKRNKLAEGSNKKSNMSLSEIKATLLIIVLSGIFVACSIPQATFYSMKNALYFDPDGDIIIVLLYQAIEGFVWIPFLFQESINWFIYFWRMDAFRNECVKFSCKK